MSRPPISYPIPTNPEPPFDDGSSHRQHGFEGSTLARDGRSGSRNAVTLDSFITRLLVVTKQLLQGLEAWAQGQITEADVSDIYVRLGNGFEHCVTLFRRYGISTADLDSVPQDLRDILERALAEEPSQDTLNIHLPEIRAIIYNLLNGLKQRQLAYKALVADRQHADSNSNSTPPLPNSRSPMRSSFGTDSDARSTSYSLNSDGVVSPAASMANLPGSTRSAPPSDALSQRSQHRSHNTARPAPPDAFRPSRSRQGMRDDSAPAPSESMRRQLSGTPPAPSFTRPPQRPQPHPDRFSHEGQVTSRFSVDSDVSTTSPRRSHTPTSPVQPKPTLAPVVTMPQAIPTPPAPPTPTPPVPPNPTPPVPPTLNFPPSSPNHGALTAEEAASVAATARDPASSSLAALQRSEALERRASKRFSSYTFNKMLPTASPNGSKKNQNGSPQRPVRRSDRIPAMPSLIESTPVGNLTHEDTMETLAVPDSPSPIPSAGSNGSATRGRSPDLAVEAPLERTESRNTQYATASEDGGKVAEEATAGSSAITAYLQLGRQVKKTTIQPPLTMSALRLMFMERFEYDPGLEDFPDVYIRDNKTGVQYELEDMADVKEGCVLTLDIEPLGQVKQHFDLTIATLVQEIKDLKTSVSQSKRMSTQVLPSLLTVSSPSQARPAAVARSPEQPPVVTMSSPLTASSPAIQVPPAPMGEPSSAAVPQAELRSHYDEVQSLRRDLAIMRQLHLDFLRQTKESFATLRAQNSAMKEVVQTKMGGNRALLDNSKAKLDSRCQDTIQVVEEVSDIIDGFREDALRRGITPTRTKMDKIRADLNNATSLVETFANDVTLAEPTWRATWLQELQRVTEEQRLLGYQNKLAADLRNDIKDATEMLDNVKAYVQQRQAGGAANKKFRPPSPEPGGSGGNMGNLLLQIRTKESDPSQRLRAIEEQQKARERDLASRTDEFQNELSGFVDGKKLRKTGGTDETERVRERRQQQTLKRMLSEEGP